jgi:hypothetical protein
VPLAAAFVLAASRGASGRSARSRGAGHWGTALGRFAALRGAAALAVAAAVPNMALGLAARSRGTGGRSARSRSAGHWGAALGRFAALRAAGAAAVPGVALVLAARRSTGSRSARSRGAGHWGAALGRFAALRSAGVAAVVPSVALVLTTRRSAGSRSTRRRSANNRPTRGHKIRSYNKLLTAQQGDSEQRGHNREAKNVSAIHRKTSTNRYRSVKELTIAVSLVLSFHLTA